VQTYTCQCRFDVSLVKTYTPWSASLHQTYTPWSVSLHQTYTKLTSQYFNFDTKINICLRKDNIVSWKHALFKEKTYYFSKNDFLKKSCFFPKHGQNMSTHKLFLKKAIKPPFLGETFPCLCHEIDGWGAPSHAKQLHQSFPGHKFEIWEGPSDWFTPGWLHFF